MSDIFTLLGIGAPVDDIDLHMTPIDTFGLFESRGDMHRVRCKKRVQVAAWEERYQLFSPAAELGNRGQPGTTCWPW